MAATVVTQATAVTVELHPRRDAGATHRVALHQPLHRRQGGRGRYRRVFGDLAVGQLVKPSGNDEDYANH
jgi:hypothetical protein